MAIQRINLGTAPSGTGGDTNRSAFTKIDGNFADTTNAASRLVGTADGNVMEAGAFGLGLINDAQVIPDTVKIQDVPNGFFRYPHNSPQRPSRMGIYDVSGLKMGGSLPSIGAALFLPYYTSASGQICLRVCYGDTYNDFYILSDRNTSVDPNGFIKRASPIVSLYADRIEPNDEAKLQDITFEKLGVGDYLVKGSLGFAQEGWYIETPKDANGNVLVAVVYEQLANNDISVKTYAKMFDEETGDIVANTAKPRDIPSTRWIDLRLQALPQDNTQPLSKDETVATNAE